MRQMLTAIFLGLMSQSAQAEDSILQRLNTGDDTRVWEAVGRLDIDGHGVCTGALIAPHLVLTAAHCLFDKRTGQHVEPEKIEFLAGWRNGRAAAYRGVRRAEAHPDYKHSEDVAAKTVRNDIALLELQHPIRNTRIVPFLTDARPRKGQRIGVVSYAHDRLEAPSLQESCNVKARQQGVLIMSCEVDFGSSGAPVFSFESGEPRVVSVVSAMAEVDGDQVSLGTQLKRPLNDLLALLGLGELENIQNVSGFTPVTERRDNGAKFSKP
ncbi:Glutamyl endopeptidase precursor [Roseovarius albus]|uniref:Glutamyl endopeptidase n=2 Tax=Roseovarius albus TaxID=1247867 RepID=A0A1X6ZQU1_9RHOB|nr:trypsin-like peptidase domain-containing protein [Roseovarius albus]SLN58683.1 Glutamyl endopeptidase precursor [Roseovarius albus]